MSKLQKFVVDWMYEGIHNKPYAELQGIMALFGYLVNQINADASRRAQKAVEEIRWIKSVIVQDRMICWFLAQEQSDIDTIFMSGSRPFAGTITPVEEFSLDSSIQIIHEFSPKVVVKPTDRRNRIHALQ